nr:S-layer family protein [Pleurocapsa sp. MO_226.B13]
HRTYFRWVTSQANPTYEKSNVLEVLSVNQVSGSIPFDEYFPSSIISSVILRGRSGFSDEVIEANPQAGDIEIDTLELKVLDGARIEATNSIGNSGNIEINARNIELNGTRPKVLNFIGGISTSTPAKSFGNGGSININTDSLKVLNGSIIRAISLGDGDAGNIKIDAQNIEIGGVDRFAENPFDLRRVSKINTGAANTNGGNLNINSDSLILDNFGLLQAVTQGTGTGGNINLNTENLELFGQSQITASAGRDGNGGNITIDTQTLLGLENSDIKANAFRGNGGNIEITAERIFGIESRESLTPDSDITADSQLGIDGTVTINAPDLDDEEFVKAAVQDFLNFVELPRGKCEGQAFLNSYPLKIGGLIQPENPYDFLDYGDDEAYRAIEQIRQGNFDGELRTLREEDPSQESGWQPGDPIIEPNAVRVDADGRSFLVRVNEEEEIPPAKFCTSQKESD